MTVKQSVGIMQGDSTSTLPRLGKFDLLFADPPFNIGQEYNGYVDQRDDFDDFTQNWIAAAWDACDGVLALHGPDYLVDSYLIAARRLGMRRIGWVNWHYRFGQSGAVESRKTWTDGRCHCLFFAKHDTWTFNGEAVAVTSDRKAVYNDKRIRPDENGETRGGTRVPFSVWGIPSDGPYWGRITKSNKERWKRHPNQLPQRYLQRIILAYTNAGDRVCDPFNGSGTTAMVAKYENRSFVGIDISSESVSSARERLERGFYRKIEVK